MHPCDNTETALRVLTAPRRNHYFYGKRMDVQHFQMEQDYGKLKQWLLNRLTLGKGVLCGLRVFLDDGKICVDPGVAIDGLGREIVVPVRACIDPATGEGGCCEPCCGETKADRPAIDGGRPSAPPVGMPSAPPAGTPSAPPVNAASAPPYGTPDNPGGMTRVPGRSVPQGMFTLWVCYKECRTDYQPVLVSDCEAREHCAPGTVVESFCLKVTPGLPPLQGDPEWCANLWGKHEPPKGDKPSPVSVGPYADAAHVGMHAVDGKAVAMPDAKDIKATMESRRHLLCELFDGKCDPREGDSCVPLAAIRMRDGRAEQFETCLVRPRIYSNAMLLDLILCLADRVEECCGHEDPPPTPTPVETMRVKSVEFLGGPGNQNVIATVQSPLATTNVPIAGKGKAIRVKFTSPFDQGSNKPTTPALGDANFKRHNFLVLPQGGGPAAGLQYAPGKLVVEGPDTLRWELHRDSPFFAANYDGWQKGKLQLLLFGSDDAASGRKALLEAGGLALDGEPIAPAGGVLSGDGTKGGDFKLVFNVG